MQGSLLLAHRGDAGAAQRVVGLLQAKADAPYQPQPLTPAATARTGASHSRPGAGLAAAVRGADSPHPGAAGAGCTGYRAGRAVALEQPCDAVEAGALLRRVQAQPERHTLRPRVRRARRRRQARSCRCAACAARCSGCTRPACRCTARCACCTRAIRSTWCRARRCHRGRRQRDRERRPLARVAAQHAGAAQRRAQRHPRAGRGARAAHRDQPAPRAARQPARGAPQRRHHPTSTACFATAGLSRRPWWSRLCKSYRYECYRQPD